MSLIWICARTICMCLFYSRRGRQQQCCQNGDDGHDHKQFYKGECLARSTGLCAEFFMIKVRHQPLWLCACKDEVGDCPASVSIKFPISMANKAGDCLVSIEERNNCLIARHGYYGRRRMADSAVNFPRWLASAMLPLKKAMNASNPFSDSVLACRKWIFQQRRRQRFKNGFIAAWQPW